MNILIWIFWYPLQVFWQALTKSWNKRFVWDAAKWLGMFLIFTVAFQGLAWLIKQVIPFLPVLIIFVVTVFFMIYGWGHGWSWQKANVHPARATIHASFGNSLFWAGIVSLAILWFF